MADNEWNDDDTEEYDGVPPYAFGMDEGWDDEDFDVEEWANRD